MRQFTKKQPPKLNPTWQQRQIDWTAELVANPSISPKSARVSYFDTIPKPDYRPALSNEQDGLCAYCESRLSFDDSGSPDNSNEIAHWEPIAAPGGLQLMLEWKNLVLSCASGESCNHAQGDQPLGIDAPHARDWSTKMQFQSSGLASSTDPDLDRALKAQSAKPP